MTPEDEEFARIDAEIKRRQGDTPPAAQPDYAWPTIEQRAVIQQMVDALDHADELLGGNDTLVMNGAAAGRWLLEQPAVQEPVACTVCNKVHAILDADESKIIRNAKDGYPDGRTPRILTLQERVTALCVYASDWKRWCLEKENTTPPAEQPVPVKTYHDGKPWPVAPKPWMGLTEEERNDLENFCEMIIGKAAFDAIEAKLREKNT